jgi:methionyl-tRNA synthetase
MNVALNALVLVCVLFESFMPSFSAKVYEQMAIVRQAHHETAIFNLQKGGKFLEQIPAGHVIGNPEPIFREIKASEGEEWRKKFGGE